MRQPPQMGRRRDWLRLSKALGHKSFDTQLAEIGHESSRALEELLVTRFTAHRTTSQNFFQASRHWAIDVLFWDLCETTFLEADFLLTQGFEDLYKILDIVNQESRPMNRHEK